MGRGKTSHCIKVLETIIAQWGWRGTVLFGISKFRALCIHSAASFFQGGNMSKALGLLSSKHAFEEWRGWLWWISLTEWRTYSLRSPSQLSLRSPMGKCHVDWHRFHLPEPITAAGGSDSNFWLVQPCIWAGFNRHLNPMTHIQWRREELLGIQLWFLLQETFKLFLVFNQPACFEFLL